MVTNLINETEILATLRSTFGYPSFRALQGEIVRSILGGKDVFVLMPTGGGKSLCYQLPAVLLDGLTVVVSPLIALMKDQVDSLQALGVAATFINSSLDANEIGRRQAAVVRGGVKLLYVAPERLMMPGFLHLLSSTEVAFFAIDEAHCISEWGHDFRPEYRQLKRLREQFPTTPLGAFTATATARVQADIKSQLGLQQADGYRGSFNRPNLFYQVRPKDGAYGQLVSYLQGKKQSSGIIYCLSRAGTEHLAGKLREDGFSAVAYHAGLESEERRLAQEAFIRDDVRIVVATIAFGMGIDKPDVRFVIHFDLPKSLEGYYQESGRAGRDSEPSDCILFYSYSDAARHRHFIDEKPSEAERKVAVQQLQQMVDWATGTSCRRRNLLAYFDEVLALPPGGIQINGTKPLQGDNLSGLAEQPGRCCDVCRTPVEEIDYTVPAQMFLSCAKRTDERFGSMYLIDVLRGSRAERVLRNRHDRLSTYGIGRKLAKEEWVHLARGLLRRGYVRQDQGDFNALKVTELGRTVLFKGATVTLPKPLVVASEPVAAEITNGALFEELRTLRKRLADERGVPPYVIFHDSTLKQMASELPMSTESLLRLQGVGQRKALDLGEIFLACIAKYVAQTGAVPATVSPSTMRRRGGNPIEMQ